ncbi:ATPase, partial [Paenibacillus sp. 28ISP30-2]|nr:ATPase [Paenibacillus sp. 28ISP30-2]
QGENVKDDEKDQLVWKEYLDQVMKKRGAEWRGLYKACKEING